MSLPIKTTTDPTYLDVVNESTIDTSNLKIGMTIKNYKQLCELLNQEVEFGNSKKSQLLEFERYFDWEKIGQKFIITDVYDTPLDKEDKRKFGNNRGKYRSGDNTFDVDKNIANKKGVYKIQKDSTIYIGSTIDSFRKRYLKHYNNYRNVMSHTKKLLNDGGKYSVLWIAPDNTSEKEIRDKELWYIETYNNDDKFNLINRQISTQVYNRKQQPKDKNKKDKNQIKIKNNYLNKYNLFINQIIKNKKLTKSSKIDLLKILTEKLNNVIDQLDSE